MSTVQHNKLWPLFLLMSGISLLTLSCISTPVAVQSAPVLSGPEMKEAAGTLASSIARHLGSNASNGHIEDVFVALLYTRNETSELIDTDIFDYSLVEELRALGVFTIRPEDREAALEEMEFNLSGMGDQTLSAGNMKSPNFFIKSLVTESSWTEGSQRVLEHVIRCELRSVETQLVVWTDDIHFIRHLAPRRNNVAW